MIVFKHQKEKAIKFTLKIEGNLQKYAMSFLHITNNARHYPNLVYKIENTSGDIVYVTCKSSASNEIEDYLKQFGTIISKEETSRIIIIPEFDAKGADELFGEECEPIFSVLTE